MKRILLLLFLLQISSISFSQSIEEILKSKIALFFEGFHKKDSAIIHSVVLPNTILSTIELRNNETRQRNLDINIFYQILSKPSNDTLEEKIINYTFLIDEILATVWTEYEFYYNGKLIHTGVNIFTLMKIENDWKISQITDSRYTKTIGDINQNDHEINNTKILNDLINNWHQNASTPNLEKFFAFMGDSCIYKGTDKTERWNKTEFYGFCKPYFDKGKAWDFKPLERHISFDDNLQTAWFDEKLDTWMGICKATGICQKVNGEWKLMHYDLSVTIDNEKIKSFIDLTNK